MLTITDKAADKVKTLLVDKEMPQGALRVFVVGGGCAGTSTAWRWRLRLKKTTSSSSTRG